MMPSEGSPRTAPTLPVHVTFLPARRPPSDLQVCSEPVMVPDLHPASTSAQTTTRMGAYTMRPNNLRSLHAFLLLTLQDSGGKTCQALARATDGPAETDV